MDQNRLDRTGTKTFCEIHDRTRPRPKNFQNPGLDKDQQNLIIADQVAPVDLWIPDGGIRTLERHLRKNKQHQFETSSKPFISNVLSFVKYKIFSDIN